MMRAPAGQAVTLRFDLTAGGEFVVPDAGSVSWSLDGGAATPIATDAVTTFVSVTVPASANTKTGAIEKRAVTVAFTHAGTGHSLRRTYILADEPPLLCGPDEVRAFLGLDEEDLADGDIDLIGAYHAVPEAIRTALSAADAHTLLRANRAIVCRAVMMFSAEALKLRLNQMEKSDQAQFQRFAGIDFQALIDAAAATYGDIVADLAPKAAAGGRTYFALTRPADVFTGT